MSTIFVKSTAGSTIQMPGTFATIPEGGLEITLDTFWARRIADGSVVVVQTEVQDTAAVESVTTKGRGR